MTSLNQRLLRAHSDGDRAALVRLYSAAAAAADTSEAAAFYLTHAYVFALESGHPDSVELRARLHAMGREH